MDLRRLEYFSAVVETGSLTAAAVQLHVSQPSLSVAIRKLEAELGVVLLVRTARGVEPTSAGRYLVSASSRVFGEVDEIVAAMRRFGTGTAGSLAIAAVPVLMWHRIPRLLRQLASEAPGVDVRLSDPPPWTAIDLLLQRSVDVAAINVFESERFLERHRGEMDVADWGNVPLVAVLPPEEVEGPDPLPLQAFSGRTIVVPRRTAALASLPEAVDAAFASHGIIPGDVRIVETIQTSIPLIEAGTAWALLPDPGRRSLTRFDVIVRDVTPAPPPLRSLVLTRSGGDAEPAVRRLLDLIRADRVS